ncbi:MAG: hypothetical protein HOB73_07810 [Planctomycetaceae bacterium]|jgi:hypothetical protein|nr:hypothetical protein [Planctomycetaceae bacterium]
MLKQSAVVFFVFTSLSAAISQAAGRPFHEIEKSIATALRLESTARIPTQRESAVVKLTELYREIMTDQRLLTSPTLNNYRVKVRARLLKILQSMEYAARHKTSNKYYSHSYSLLDTLQQHLQSSSHALGGANRMLQGNAGQGVQDYGPALVNLIKTTISPEFWDISGGPGVIVYYPPLRLLVIRATSEIHYQIGGLR